MIYVVGNAPHSVKYNHSTIPQFLTWFNQQHTYQLDIETTVTEWWCDKKLITIQFGSYDGEERWVIQWSYLNDAGKAKMKEILQDDSKTKLIHNATFEYVVLRFYGIILNNVYDTMIVEQILWGGFQAPKNGPGIYGLANLSERYLNMEMDKTEQTNFGDNILTESKVVYAADDVYPLGIIRTMQIMELKDKGLEAVAALENEAVLGYGDMTYNGIELNTEDWLANLALVEPLVLQSIDTLNSYLVSEDVLYKKAKELNFVSSEDRILINWNSHIQKGDLLRLLIPDLPGATKVILTKWVREHEGHEYVEAIKRVINKDYSLVESSLLSLWNSKLIEMGLVIPANRVTINWNSPKQVLPILQVIQPKLKAMDDESFKKFANHPIFEAISDYKDNLKLRGTYGQSFIDQHVEPDGKVRTRINQIVTTGRISSSSPNMQNIPVKETVGNRYRNAFTCPIDWSYVDSDYVSQELVIIAYLSRDPVWINALEKGQDLHSVCAELVHGRKWKDAADSNCAFYAKDQYNNVLRQKCNCKAHKRMRNGIKSINFG